jgi:hypothetical protein
MKTAPSLWCAKNCEIKSEEMRNENIGSLVETRDQKMDCAHRNRPGNSLVPRNFELKFEQPGGSRSVVSEGK